jgi:hypothetical protein
MEMKREAVIVHVHDERSRPQAVLPYLKESMFSLQSLFLVYACETETILFFLLKKK